MPTSFEVSSKPTMAERVLARHDASIPDKSQHDRAPLWENIQDFRAHLKAPFYCPGHKGGRSLPPELTENWASCDLNNLPDTDTLHCPTGSMRDAEQLLADAYGVKRSFLLVGGSSLGNMAAVMSCVSPGDTVLVQRNAHKSVIAGIIHSGAIPQWIVPAWDVRFGISHGLSLQAVEQAIASFPHAKALVALNPTYFGVVPDMAAIAQACKQHGITLIADEAHGPHFRFGGAEYPLPAENAGADIVVQSTHKILSGLSQAAVLHVCSDKVDLARVQATLQSLQTTSPNFAILASIDLARRQMMLEGSARLQALRCLADEARQELSSIVGMRCMGAEHQLGQGSGFDDFDRTKLLIDTQACGWSGSDVQRTLNRQFGVQPELSGASYVLCIMTLGSNRHDVECLVGALKSISLTEPPPFENLHDLMQLAGRVAVSLPESVMSPRDAFYRPHLEVPFNEALDCVAGEIITPYPPGIPVLMPGERFDRDTMELLTAVKRSRCPISAVDPTLSTVRVVNLER